MENQANSRFNKKNVKYINLINAALKPFIREKNKPDHIDLNQVKSILIVDISLIGDEIMNIPFYRAIKKHISDSEITVLGRPWIKDQLLEHGVIDHFIEFDGLNLLKTPSTWAKNRRIIKETLRKVNEKRYDLAIEPRGDIRYVLFMHYCNSTYKVSYNFMRTEYMLSLAVPAPKKEIHEIDSRLGILECLGITLDASDRIPILETTEEQKKDNELFVNSNNLSEKIIIGIHPGASLKIKQYTFYPEAMKQVCEKLENKSKYYFIVFCGKGEERIAQNVCSAIQGCGYETYVLKESLTTYIGRIDLCSCMLCNDSGAGHIAAAYGKPVTVIFGPILPQLYKPRGRKKVRCISKELDCKPCMLPYCQLGTNECIKSITVDEVAEAVKKMISEVN